MPTSQLTGSPSFFAARIIVHGGGGRQAAEVQARAGGAHELAACVPSAIVSVNAGMPGETQARRHLAVVRDAFARQPFVLGAQPDREAEGRRVLQRAPQHLRVGDRHVGLRERDAARLREHRHLGQALARELHRERADRVDARARQRLGAPAQHVDQARLVQRRHRCPADRRGSSRRRPPRRPSPIRAWPCTRAPARAGAPRGRSGRARRPGPWRRLFCRLFPSCRRSFRRK